jgi:putative ABC transport system permease protein
MRDGLLVTGLGILLGGLAVASLTSTLSALQYGISATDPVSCLFVGGLLALAALLATWRPAAQAVRADPVLLLKDE